MFKRLQTKWGVGPGRLVLIIMTFALGGSATGYIGRTIMSALSVTSPWLYVPVYLVLITLLWPILVLVVSIPFGQFPFFQRYIRKLFKRLQGKHHQP